MQNSDEIEYDARIFPADKPEVIPPSFSPDNPPWTSGIAFGAWVFSVLMILFIPAVIVLPYVFYAGPAISDSEAFTGFLTTDKTALLLQIAAILPAHLLTLGVAYYVVTQMKKYSFREMLGWSSGGVKWWWYPAIMVAFLAFASALTSFMPEQENEFLKILKSSREAVYVVAIMATLTAPIVEEVIYRGVLYSAFQRSVGVPAAFVLVTVLFAIVHVPQYYPSAPTIILLTLLSVMLTAIRVYSKNLLPCIILHTVFNGVQSLALILEPWFDQVEVPAIDPAILTQLIK